MGGGGGGAGDGTVWASQLECRSSDLVGFYNKEGWRLFSLKRHREAARRSEASAHIVLSSLPYSFLSLLRLAIPGTEQDAEEVSLLLAFSHTAEGVYQAAWPEEAAWRTHNHQL